MAQMAEALPALSSAALAFPLCKYTACRPLVQQYEHIPADTSSNSSVTLGFGYTTSRLAARWQGRPSLLFAHVSHR